MKKCEHGVRIPEDIEGENNPYCSGCRPHADRTVKLWIRKRERESDEIQKEECPICVSTEFQYLDETHYLCPRCGFDNYCPI